MAEDLSSLFEILRRKEQASAGAPGSPARGGESGASASTSVPPSGAAAGVVPGEPSAQPGSAGSAPRPLSKDQELLQYLRGRLEEMEKKVTETQEKALAATIQLREREAAQRQAQQEIESILKTVEATRKTQEADQRMREELVRSQTRTQDLEARLTDLAQKELQKNSEWKEGLERVLREHKEKISGVLPRLEALEGVVQELIRYYIQLKKGG